MTDTTSSLDALPADFASQANRNLSLAIGPNKPDLLITTVGSLIEQQVKVFGDRCAVSVPWQSVRLSYRDVAHRSKLVAMAMLEMGLSHGDCVGVMAGNCFQYIEIFLGAARIGCPVVVINNTFSPLELAAAVTRVNCKLLFIASTIGTRSCQAHIEKLVRLPAADTHLQCLVALGDHVVDSRNGHEIQSYHTFLGHAHSIRINDAVLRLAELRVAPSDVLNLQFTSGTTGIPKAASLTHVNLINNGRYVGNSMQLTKEDVVCCPPPLFHCFGLVMGFLASFCHGSCIIFPSDSFDAQKTIESVVAEKATALLGVPTMFIAELEVLEMKAVEMTTVRTGLAAGSPVSKMLMEKLRDKMNIQGMLIAYGMTETSPVTFITSLDDPDEKMLNSIGRVFPHTSAKVIDNDGNIVPVGSRGEICTSGFALQKGYWSDEAKTQEVMKRDEDGVLWMHTGDEGFIDSEGYGHITGRIKDIIIRGGENITPLEIENRLLAHASIAEACVVGLTDEKYGEAVSCFLRSNSTQTKPLADDQVRGWVEQALGRVKAPRHVFWLGHRGIGRELPKTGSGKYQKHLIRDMGEVILKRGRGGGAKL
ncbi:hypothetical protein B0J13DRAFT_479035 [Dactylonectria estremocensis]|uniref:Uncharacterized protein n=1 Tax=Dactylonectria estremocensis TaxID=1079267 RepID=A0A9P9EHY8_9HYPO|nr:hypothetical protein B0J13DRAFT_479035 [Dactylonectria estremocensis]